MRAAAPLRRTGPGVPNGCPTARAGRSAHCRAPSPRATRPAGTSASPPPRPAATSPRRSGRACRRCRCPDPTSTPPDVTTNTHWTVANQGLILHDLDHRQARDTRYKHCGWKVAYDCKAGDVLEPGVPFWGGSDPGSCNDTMCSCVWVDLPDKHGLLFFGQLATTPEGYTAPGDPDGLIHQGYGNAFHYTSTSGLPNVCCHNQDDPYWGTTGPFAHYRVRVRLDLQPQRPGRDRAEEGRPLEPDANESFSVQEILPAVQGPLSAGHVRHLVLRRRDTPHLRRDERSRHRHRGAERSADPDGVRGRLSPVGGPGR